MMKLTIAIFVALCLTQVSESIKCYKCSSTSDLTCTDDAMAASDKFKINCALSTRPSSLPSGPDQVTRCSKVVAKDSSGVTVSRGCHWEIPGKDPKMCTVAENQMLESCKVCDTDFCNTAPNALAAFGVPALVAAVMGARALW